MTNKEGNRGDFIRGRGEIFLCGQRREFLCGQRREFLCGRRGGAGGGFYVGELNNFKTWRQQGELVCREM